MPVLSIDYRMAPEWKAPAGIEDALDALIWMGANGPDGPAKARKLFVTGDSSGGGMAVAVLLAAQVIPPIGAEGLNRRGPGGILPAVSWSWVPACGSLEPPRRGGENAQKTGKNGEKMGEIRPKKCEPRELTKDQLAGRILGGAGFAD